MKLFNKILSIVFLITVLMSLPAYSQTQKASVEKEVYDPVVISLMFNSLDRKEWNIYFKNYAKQLRKNWKKNKALFKNKKYKTSYARVFFVVNKQGEIVSYKIKSYCIPSNDEIFLSSVKNTIAKAGKIAVFPPEYKENYLIFTVKLHTNLPDHINSANIDWSRYGMADVEIDKRRTKVIFGDI